MLVIVLVLRQQPGPAQPGSLLRFTRWWGLALATKFPALLMPIPLLLWAHLFDRKSYANNVLAMFFLSPLIIIAIQPYLWHQPGMRILEFLFEGLSRAYRPETNYTVFFFGNPYITNQLPWYYPFFVIGVTSPEAVLALALFGVSCIAYLWEQRPVILLLLLNAVFIPVMGLLPGGIAVSRRACGSGLLCSCHLVGRSSPEVEGCKGSRQC